MESCGCKVYEALTMYLRQMPNETPGTTILYYNMARNVLFTLLIANELLSKDELEKEFEHNIGSKLYDDMDWLYERAKVYQERYADKLKLIQEKNTCSKMLDKFIYKKYNNTIIRKN